MAKSKKFLFSLSLFTCLATTGFTEISESPLEVNLKDPEFANGQISTDKGGIITMGNLRIQAQKIEYVNKIENGEHVQKIIAEENLLLEYDKQFFIGSKLEYDLTRKKGTIWDGKTFTGAWFVGGDKIELEEDGTLYIHNAYITTSENQEKTWHIDASQIKISSTQILTADNIQVRFIKVPLFWFPKVKTNLKAFSSSPLRYKLTWDKNLGPKISMRYQIFASDYSDVYARLDYRGKNRFGGAIESEYYSEDGRGSFLTKNYVAHDKLVPDEHGDHRHRFQGLLHAQSKNDKTFLDISWDQMTDNKMPGDFKSDDFEVNTEKRTLLRLQHNEPLAVSSLRIQPRVNTFQSVSQQLPLATVGVHPFSFGSSGIIANNNFEVSYLDYIYAKDLSPDVTNFYGGRLSI